MTSRAAGPRLLSGLALCWLVTACGTERIRLLEPPADLPMPDAGAPTIKVKDAGTPDASSSVPPAIRSIERSACAKSASPITQDAALLMMVIDVSGSMTFQDPTSTNKTTKWGVERPALGNAIDNFPAGLGVGILFFPNQSTPPNTMKAPASTCIAVEAMIPVDYLGPTMSRQRYAIQRGLSNTEPNTTMGTPTLDAYLVALQSLGGTTLAGSRQILLITDGQPTFAEGCVGTGMADMPIDETPIIQAIAAAKRAGISTFVIGAPGSEQGYMTNEDARPWLSRAAEAGGTARPGCSDNGPRYCHFDMTVEQNFGQGLTEALNDIVGNITRCDVRLPSPPPNQRIDFSHINVVVDRKNREPVLLQRSDSPSCTDGWQYAGDHLHITLCPNTCNALRGDPNTQVEVFVGCTTQTTQVTDPPGGTLPRGGQR